MSGLNEIAKEAELPKEAVSAVFAAIKSLIADGQMVIIKGFGTFRTKTRKARSFKTKIRGQFEVGEHRSITFKAVRELRFLPVKRIPTKTRFKFPKKTKGEEKANG